MKKINPVVWAVLAVPVIYMAMVLACSYEAGTDLFALMERFGLLLGRPDLLRWTAYTPRCILGALVCYGLAVTLYYSDHENRRPGEEYGSAKWGSARELNKQYADPNGKNVILTKHVSIGLDGYKHQRNLNILVVGGSGSGKTRFFCKPGIMSVNCSYLIVDPKGEMLRSTGYLLKDEGYDITGSLNVFAHQTNIDTRNRIICYDIQDLGENLKPIGLLVMLDSILNRVIRNRQQGRYTHVYIDEIYLFFASPGVGGTSAINNYSSEFLYKCWKRFRKYYATLTGITQNVEECLLSDTARLMFANSEFLVLLNQAPTDRAELAKLLDASDAQMDYVSDAPAGHGLIKVGSCLVPFINELPRDTELYRLMTTKPGEQNA